MREGSVKLKFSHIVKPKFKKAMGTTIVITILVAIVYLFIGVVVMGWDSKDTGDAVLFWPIIVLIAGVFYLVNYLIKVISSKLN